MRMKHDQKQKANFIRKLYAWKGNGMKINTAIAETRKKLVEVVNACELPPAVTGMILNEVLQAVNAAARAQYEAELKDADQDKGEVEQ